MSKNAKFLPMVDKPTVRWIEPAKIDWSGWEKRIAAEIGREDFCFEKQHKEEISDALFSLNQKRETIVKLEDAKTAVRRLRSSIERTNLPDQHLINPKKPWEPSELLMRLGFAEYSDIFTEAMLHTVDHAQDGKNVPQRLGFYLADLRKGECVIDAPKKEAVAAYRVKKVLESCGIRADVTHTWPTAAGEGNESISVFEAFVFEHIMPDLGSDPNAKRTLRRRLEEAAKFVNKSPK